MSYSTQTKDVANLIRILMQSTRAHVYSSIMNPKDREAYLKAMNRCYFLCSQTVTGDNPVLMLKNLQKMKKTLPQAFNQRFEIFSNVKKYYLLGVQQSIEIVLSMQDRFLTLESRQYIPRAIL